MPIRAVVFDLFDTLVDLRAEDLPMEEHKGRRIPASARFVHGLVAERHPGVEFDAFQEAMLEGMQAFLESHLKNDREVTTFERFADALSRVGIDDAPLAERMTRSHMGVLKSAVRVILTTAKSRTFSKSSNPAATTPFAFACFWSPMAAGARSTICPTP